MPPTLQAERRSSRADRGPLLIVGLALVALAVFAVQAKSGHHVQWWNWVISSLVITNTAVASLPALRTRPRLSLMLSRISLGLTLAVIVATLAQMQG
jgi:hypothetical protein